MRARIVFAAIVVLAFIILVSTTVLRKGEVVASSSGTGVFPPRTEGGFVTSESCARCHPDQHATWHDTYHSRMTQVASPETVVAPFDNVTLETSGQTARLERRGDEFWVNTLDPAWEKKTFTRWAEGRSENEADPFENAEFPHVDAKVVMTTGSHHFQAYWLEGEQGEMVQFPWRYHIAEQRWVHRKDVFLVPPEWRPGMWARTWNHQCSVCHSTGPHPGLDQETGAMNTRVAEFGIACESCHGPAKDHILFHDGALQAKTDPITNPAKLEHQRSAEVCGQCHSHFSHSDPLLNVHGPQFRPGENLYHFGSLIDPPPDLPVMSRFWGDGTNRSGGREFSGLSSSACFLNGDMTCLSCHSMHNSDPNDQLKEIAFSNEACLQCHEDMRDALPAHTHHSADSSGSQCYNCHMPHTNYALYKAIRSHQIDIPKVFPLQSNSRPNACNLCHLDQSLGWAADRLEEWYAIAKPPLNQDEQQVSAGVLWALKGDAGQRIIAAWHFGWQPARLVSGADWMIPAIANLMKDPYSAVRWVAYASLRKTEQFANVDFEFDASAELRDPIADNVLERWLESRAGQSVRIDRKDRVLIKDDGRINDFWFQRLLQQRDNRMVSSVE